MLTDSPLHVSLLFRCGHSSRGQKLELAFICEPIAPAAPRAPEFDVPPSAVLDSLADFRATKPDLIIEVAHPSISKNYGMGMQTHIRFDAPLMLSVE